MLARHGQNLIANEFHDIVKHYSSEQFESVTQFIEFLLDQPDPDEAGVDIVTSASTNSVYKASGRGAVPAVSAAAAVAASANAKMALFIPAETIVKLEMICAWMLRREQQYELYDEAGEHCDIITKLRFGDIRNDYVKTCMITYLRLNTIDWKRAHGSTYGKRFIKSVSNLFEQQSASSATAAGNANVRTASLKKSKLSQQNSLDAAGKPKTNRNIEVSHFCDFEKNQPHNYISIYFLSNSLLATETSVKFFQLGRRRRIRPRYGQSDTKQHKHRGHRRHNRDICRELGLWLALAQARKRAHHKHLSKVRRDVRGADEQAHGASHRSDPGRI